MLISRDPKIAERLFVVATLLIVAWVYARFDDPISFGFMGGGVIVFSYFVRRGIKQMTGS
jgi:hypothetical protein